MNDDTAAPASSAGWIKLHRRFDCDGHLQRMPNAALRLYMHFLLRMCWRPVDGLRAGQLRTKYAELKERFSFGNSTISGALTYLRANGYITTEQANQMAAMVVTVLDIAVAADSPETGERTPETGERSPETGERSPDPGVSHSSTGSAALLNEEYHTPETGVPDEVNALSGKGSDTAEEGIKNTEEEEKKSETGQSDTPDGELATRKKYPADFEELWELYPHPPGDEKGRAARNYAKLRKTVSAEDLLTAARNYGVSRKGKDPEYHKKAANFLGKDGTWPDWISPNLAAASSGRAFAGASRRPGNTSWEIPKEEQVQ